MVDIMVMVVIVGIAKDHLLNVNVVEGHLKLLEVCLRDCRHHIHNQRQGLLRSFTPHSGEGHLGRKYQSIS